MAGGVNVNLTANVSQFQQAMRQAEQNLTHFEQHAKKATDAAAKHYQDASGRWRDASGRFLKDSELAAAGLSKVTSGTKALEEVSIPAAAAFASLSLGIAMAVRTFGDFEAVLNQTKAVSGATAEEMGRLKAQALELGAATKFSAKEAAQAQAELSKSGMSVNQTLAATPGVMALAASGQLDVAKAAEITGAALNGFGLGAEKAGYVADLLSKAANASALDVADVGESLKYASTIAASTSQSIEEVATNLAIMGNAGIKGSQGGTVFRSALASLAKPSDDAADKLHALKISIQDTSGKMLPLSDIIGQLRTNTAKLTEVQRANAIAMIFGQEAMSGIMAMMKQTPAQVDAVTAAFRDVNGAAAETAATMNSGLNGALEQMGGSLDTAVTLLGEQLAPAIMAIAKGIEAAADDFNKLDAGTKTLIAGAVAAATAMTGLVAVLGGAAAILPTVAAGFALLGVGMAPVLGTVVALSAAVGVVTMVLKANSDAAAANAAETAKANQERKTAAEAAIRHKAELAKLVEEHDKLMGSAKRTKEEEARLKAIMEKVQGISPELARALGGLEGQHWANAKAVLEHNKQLAQNIALQRQALAADITKASINLRRKAVGVDTEAGTNAAKRAALTGRTTPVGIPTADELKAALKENTSILVESKEAKELRAAQEALAAFDKAVKGEAPKVDEIDRGGIVPGGGSSKPTKAGKDKSADEAHRRQVEALGRLQAAYQRTLTIAQAWGGGTAAEVNGLTKLIADIKAKGLDKVEEGQEAVINAQTRLNVLAGQSVMAAKAKEAAEAKAFEEQALENIVAAVERQLAAEQRAEDERKRIADEAKARAEAFKGSIREIQGALAALAIDPSLERIANFAQSLDEDKVKAWADTLGQVGKAFSDAGGGADGFDAALKKIGDNADPVALAILAVVEGLKLLKWAWDGVDEAINGRKGMRESLDGLWQSIKVIDTKQELGIYTAFDAATEKVRELRQEIDNLAKQLADEKDPAQQARLRQNIGSLRGQLSQQQSVASQLNPDQGQNLGSVIAASIKPAIDAAIAQARQAAGALAELAGGGRDDWGNRVSLYRERDLQIQQAETDLADKKTDALKAQLKLREEIAEIDREERAAVAAIENEGIAVRAKSEYQDKAERIDKVKAEAKAKRDAKNDEIKGIDEQIAKEELATAKAISNIRILSQERIDQLSRELGGLKAITAELERQAAIARQASGGFASPVNSSGQVNGAAVTVGTTAANMSGDGSTLRWDGTRWNRAATGGMVAGGIPGKDSVPVLAMPGEVIVSEPVTKGLAAMVNAFQRGRMGPMMPPGQMAGAYNSQVVTVGDINVYAAPGMNERDLAGFVKQTLAYEIRRSGAFR